MRNTLRHFLLGAVLVALYTVMPWRVMGLAVETLVIRPSQPHFSADDSRFWEAVGLESRLNALGWTVTYQGNLAYGQQAAYGLADPQTHRIYVDADLHWSARAAVLAHEAGHTLQPGWAGRMEGDCFAETVAALVVHDGLRDHARFMAPARFTCVAFMLAEFPAMYHAAALLLD